jgi:flagellin
MSLGVLNNLSAVYAENNLNNSNNSLNTVLQQLSSGSKINSGADDAAGLSLVDGLQANQTALTQSVTNATEGVGLLQVADGALSQVTSLLNRAVTLATEASNGTLNSAQDTAANQEYQSILSEISNIGTTTTYNDAAVFNKSTNIYTGDSSTTGSSIDDLNIRTLSSSNVGDSGGIMAYSGGTNSVFINLSSSSKNAQSTDLLNTTSGSTSINVNYLVKGSNGQESTATTSITVGSGTTYANTANGLISAIDNSGLGLSANFTTQSQAGVAGGGTQTGIQITGGLVSVGVDPNAVTTSGTLNLTGTSANSLLTQGQTVTIQSGSLAALSVVVGPTTQTLSDLATAINTASGSANPSTTTQVAATVVTNSQGVQSLSLTNTGTTEGQLQVSTSQTNYAPALTTNNVTSGSNPVSLSFTSGTPGTSPVAGSYATGTLGVTGIGANAAAAPLSGSLVLSNGANTITINTNQGSATNSGTTINLATGHSTLSDLSAALDVTTAGSASLLLGVSASVGSNGLTLTSNAVNTTIAQVSSSLSATPTLNLSDVVNGAASSPATTATTTLSMVNSGNAAAGTYANGDVLTAGSSIVVTNGSTDAPGTPITFVVGGNTLNDNNGNGHTDTANTYFTGGANTVGGLLGVMATAGTGGTAAHIASAAVNGGQIVITSSLQGTTLNVTSALVDQGTSVAASSATSSGVPASAPGGQATLLTGTTLAAGSTLSGSVVISNGLGGVNGSTTFHMGGGNGGTTLTTLKDAINADTALDITAAIDSTNGGLDLTSATNGTQITIGTGANNTLGVSYGTEFTNPASGSSSLGTQYEGGILNLSNLGSMNSVDSGNGVLTGSLILSNNVGGTGVISDTFNFGVGAGDSQTGNTWNLSTADSTVAGLEAAINGTGATWSVLGGAGNTTVVGAADSVDVVASVDTASGGLFVQSAQQTDTTLGATTTGLTDVASFAKSDGSAGTIQAAANVTFSNASNANNANDVLTGHIVIKNSAFGNYGAGSVDTTFTVGGGAEAGLGTANVTVNGSTLQALATAINDDSTGSYTGVTGIGLSASVSSTGLTLTSVNNSTNISDAASTLKDNYGASVNDGTGATFAPATAASAILGADQAIAGSDALSGTIVLNNGGSNYTFNMSSTNVNASATATDIYTNGTNIQDLANSISGSGLGVNATVVNGALQLQSGSTDTTIAVQSSSLKDTQSESLQGGATLVGSAGNLGLASNATINLAGGINNLSVAHQDNDTLTGAIVLNNGATSGTFTMGATGNGGTTLQSLASAINNDTALGLNAATEGYGLSLTMSNHSTTPITVGANSLNDTMGNTAASLTLGSFRSESDTLSAGTISFSIGGSAEPGITVSANETVSALVTEINGGGTNPYGVSATWNSGTDQVVLTSNSYGVTGNFSATSSNVTDTTTGLGLSYSMTSAYNVGISNSTGANALYDSSTQSLPSASASEPYSNFVGNTGGSSGTATISYSDGAGVSLSATDLSNQADAESALTSLNAAITAVAGQDGYIGAQINTLNAVSHVLSTQQENVQAAQNAVQATDYASATSNMSKYEILSQTGIAALAQANSVQQEVTKLLQ